MKSPILRILSSVTALLLLIGCLTVLPMTISADEDTVYLGNREDLFVERDSLDGLGMNTAHSGEPLTVGSARFETGVGFHCQPDRDAYVEFNIEGLDMSYFAASVGVLKEANYFMEWGSISFHVYGDGKLLASTPVMLWGDEPYFLTCSVEGVKKLRLVQNNEGGHSCDAGIWGDARVTKIQPAAPDAPETVFDPDHTTDPHPEEVIMGDYTYISDLYWTDTKTYPGNFPGRDSNTCNEMIFSSDGTYFPKGVGLHAISSNYEAFVEVNIDGLGYTKFASFYGVCETLSVHDITMAQVKLAVFGDGEKIWESDTMTFGKPMERMECDISGVKTLRIAVAGAPGIAGAWATWGGAVLSKSGTITDEMLFEELSFGEKETETEAESMPETIPETEPDTTPESETGPDPDDCEHLYGPWTHFDDEFHKQVCHSCGASWLGQHAWDGGVIKDGEIIYQCTICLATKTEKVPTTETDPTSETDPETETDAPAEDGCASTLATGALLGVAGGAILCRKRKED